MACELLRPFSPRNRWVRGREQTHLETGTFIPAYNTVAGGRDSGHATNYITFVRGSGFGTKIMDMLIIVNTIHPDFAARYGTLDSQL